MFLDESQAAESEDEATQRAAVAALHRLAGERALERVLPRQYVPYWQQLGEQARAAQMRVAPPHPQACSRTARLPACAA